jgi:hypothetical protein
MGTLLTASAPPRHAVTPGTGEAAVQFREGTTPEEIVAIHAQIGADVVRNLSATFQWVRAHGYADDDLIHAYAKRPEVASANRAPNRMK